MEKQVRDKTKLLNALRELHAEVMKQKIRNTIRDFEERIARIEVMAGEAKAETTRKDIGT